MAGLTLRLDADDYGEGECTAVLDAGGFRGRGRFWCPPSEFADLALALAAYPIDPAAPICGDWAGGISLLITPVNATGRLAVKASIEDIHGTGNRCDATFHCHYADLDRFREGLEAAIRAGIGRAVLAAA